MISPWTKTTVVRGITSLGTSRCTWNRTPLATTSAIDSVSVSVDALVDVGDEATDRHGDDLLEVHLADEGDEVDLVAVPLPEPLGEGDELDALDGQVVVETGLRRHLDVEE